MREIIDIFSKLGKRVADGVPTEISDAAIAQNEWYSTNEINCAMAAIRVQMLDRKRLTEWLSGYTHSTQQRSVLIVMAGNIPMVGFFDLLCVLAAGHRAVVKLSHKDQVLMEWIIDLLRDIDPQIPISIYNENIHIDMVIATGGESAVRHFKTQYGDLPSLLRGSRESAAVITSGTTDKELLLLANDIYTYSGLGCRNISMLFVPKGFDLTRVPTATHPNPKFRNNYRQNRALLSMSGAEFFNNGIVCMRQSEQFPTTISEISVIEYSTIDEVERWLALHDSELQCVVAPPQTLTHPRQCRFGEAQSPTLNDYADGIDTMKFLCEGS